MSLVRYFAYGSNLDAQQMAQRCPSSRALFRARLRDHRLDFTYFSSRWWGGAADTVPHSGESVWGIIYELQTAELAQLDRYEAGYRRMLLSVEDDRGSPHTVVSYSILHKLSFRPAADYVLRMLDWGERWNLPREYLEDLRRVRVL